MEKISIENADDVEVADYEETVRLCGTDTCDGAVCVHS